MKTYYSLVLFVVSTLFFSLLRAEVSGGPSDLSEASKVDIKRLESQIQKQQDEYQKRPKRIFIGNNTKNKQFNDYVESWGRNMEKICNENYSLQAKNNKLNAILKVSVSIKSDGELEGIQINESSGYKAIDENVIDTIKKSAPFESFSDEMKKDADILTITRTWTLAY